MLTLEQAKMLRVGQIVYHNSARNRDGLPVRAKITGAVKTWKRSPEKVKVPFKHGMYTFGYITELNLQDWFLSEEEAIESYLSSGYAGDPKE